MNEHEHHHGLPESAATAEAQLLRLQTRVLSLSELDLRRRWTARPDLERMQFGPGTQTEQTLRGNDREPFAGVAIYNTSGSPVAVNFSGSGAERSPLICAPNTLLVWPARYVDVSIFCESDTPTEVAVLRLVVPPETPATYPAGAQATLWNPATGQAEIQRTPTVWVPIDELALEPNVDAAIWTPAADKRFRFLGSYMQANESEDGVGLVDGAAAARFFYFGAFGNNVTYSPIGNGYLSTAPGNALSLRSTVASTVNGTVWGTEE